MTENRRPDMSEAERDVLKALWDHGPGTVRELHEHFTARGWSRSTVITLLQRLERKGYVASDKSAYAFVFRALVTRGELAEQRVAELAEELYEGEPTALMLAFAERHRFTEDEIRRFRELIDRHHQAQQPPGDRLEAKRRKPRK